MSPRRPIRNRTNFELARGLVDQADALLELHRRWVAEEERLTAALGEDEPPTFEDLVAWIVERGRRHPHRPPGRRERPQASVNRSLAARRRHARARAQQTASEAVA